MKLSLPHRVVSNVFCLLVFFNLTLEWMASFCTCTANSAMLLLSVWFLCVLARPGVLMSRPAQRALCATAIARTVSNTFHERNHAHKDLLIQPHRGTGTSAIKVLTTTSNALTPLPFRTSKEPAAPFGVRSRSARRKTIVERDGPARLVSPKQAVEACRSDERACPGPSTVCLHIAPLLRRRQRLARDLASVRPGTHKKTGKRHTCTPRLSWLVADANTMEEKPRHSFHDMARRTPNTHNARRVRAPTRRPTYLELPDERRKEAKAWLLTS